MDENIGKKFDQLTVVSKTSVTHENEFMYKLKCDCSNVVYQRISIIKKGLMPACPDCQKINILNQ